MILRKKMEKVKIGYASRGCPNPSLSISFDRGAQMTRGNGGEFKTSFPLKVFLIETFIFPFFYKFQNWEKMTLLIMTLNFEKLKMKI